MTVGDQFADTTLKKAAFAGLLLSLVTWFPTFPGHCAATHNFEGWGWGGVVQCTWCADKPDLQRQYASGDLPIPAAATTLAPNTTIAFIGDTGSEEEAWGVTAQMIADYVVDGVLHVGDMSYPIFEEDPAEFFSVMEKHLEGVPIIPAIGNHDTMTWHEDHEGGEGFQNRWDDRMTDLMEAPGSKVWCSGDVGRNSYCYMAGILFATSEVSIVTCDNTDVVHAEYMADVLGKNRNGELQDGVAAMDWKVVGWHKNMAELQGGNKDDGTGWQIFETVIDYGAMVVNGHEHSYTRTATLENPLRDLKCRGESCEDSREVTELGPGYGPVLVSGLGGGGVRDVIMRPHFLVGAGDKEASPEPDSVIDVPLAGALFCSFNVEGNPLRADCNFRTTEGVVIDEFTIINDPTSTEPAGNTLTPSEPSTFMFVAVAAVSYLFILATCAVAGLFGYRKTPYYESRYVPAKSTESTTD